MLHVHAMKNGMFSNGDGATSSCHVNPHLFVPKNWFTALKNYIKL